MKKGSKFFYTSLIIFVFSLFLFILSRRSESLAQIFSDTVGTFLRNALLIFSNLIPFSLFELILVLLPAIAVLCIYFLKKASGVTVKKRFLSILGVFLLIFSISINTFFVSFGKSSDMKISKPQENEVSLALSRLAEKLNSFENPTYPDREELSFKLYSAYSSLEQYDVSPTVEVPKIKKIKNEALASRLGILGKYSSLTSEVSVNFSAPEYTVCFSTAHELAHLFGISGEGEACFFAFLASLETEDEGIMYSACLSAFEAVFAEFSSNNKELSQKIYKSLPEIAKNDISEYSIFYYKNHGKITDTADKANGALLDFATQGKEKDYSLFSRLLVAYLTSCGN